MFVCRYSSPGWVWVRFGFWVLGSEGINKLNVYYVLYTLKV